MLDSFVQQLIVKYHNQGRTEIEIAVITGQPVSEVRVFLEQIGLKNGAKSLQETSTALNIDLNKNQEPSKLTAKSHNSTNSASTQKKLKSQIQKSSSDAINQLKKKKDAPNKASAKANKSKNKPKSKEDTKSTRDNSDKTKLQTNNNQALALADNKSPIATKTASRRKSLEVHRSLIIKLLESNDYNCSAVYRQLINMGIKAQLRTVQRFCKPLIVKHQAQLSQKLLDMVINHSPTNLKADNSLNDNKSKESNESLDNHYDKEKISPSPSFALGATLMANNVVTIPLAIREVLDLNIHDQIMFVYHNGQVFLCKKPQ